MHDPSDIEFQRTQPIARGPAPRRYGPLIGGAAAALAVILAVYFLFIRPRDAEGPGVVETPAPAEAPPAAAPALPPAAGVGPIDLPPLGETDAIVRSLFGVLSSHPRVAAWLAGDQRIRNFVVVVANIADGDLPSRHLPMLAPAGAFRVVERGQDLLIDPRSYDRYAPIAAAAGSIDPQGAARLYTALKPRIDEAALELGQTEPFDRTLERAVRALLAVPALGGDVRVEPHGATYRFDDPRVEGLSAAQKQLARMGPAHVLTIQARLREIARLLGVTGV